MEERQDKLAGHLQEFRQTAGTLRAQADALKGAAQALHALGPHHAALTTALDAHKRAAANARTVELVAQALAHVQDLSQRLQACDVEDPARVGEVLEATRKLRSTHAAVVGDSGGNPALSAAFHGLLAGLRKHCGDGLRHSLEGGNVDVGRLWGARHDVRRVTVVAGGEQSMVEAGVREAMRAVVASGAMDDARILRFHVSLFHQLADIGGGGGAKGTGSDNSNDPPLALAAGVVLQSLQAHVRAALDERVAAAVAGGGEGAEGADGFRTQAAAVGAVVSEVWALLAAVLMKRDLLLPPSPSPSPSHPRLPHPATLAQLLQELAQDCELGTAGLVVWDAVDAVVARAWKENEGQWRKKGGAVESAVAVLAAARGLFELLTSQAATCFGPAPSHQAKKAWRAILRVCGEGEALKVASKTMGTVLGELKAAHHAALAQALVWRPGADAAASTQHLVDAVAALAIFEVAGVTEALQPDGVVAVVLESLLQAKDERSTAVIRGLRAAWSSPSDRAAAGVSPQAVLACAPGVHELVVQGLKRKRGGKGTAVDI